MKRRIVGEEESSTLTFVEYTTPRTPLLGSEIHTMDCRRTSWNATTDFNTSSVCYTLKSTEWDSSAIRVTGYGTGFESLQEQHVQIGSGAHTDSHPVDTEDSIPVEKRLECKLIYLHRLLRQRPLYAFVAWGIGTGTTLKYS